MEKGWDYLRNVTQRFWLDQSFWIDQQAQDLTEYALMLAFVVLAAAGIFLASSTSIVTIWSVSNNIVTAAAQQAHASS
jgi:Flp pilus assembly pilin Flp